MGNEFGRPEEEEEPVIKFVEYATMEEINAEARLNRGIFFFYLLSM